MNANLSRTRPRALLALALAESDKWAEVIRKGGIKAG